MTESTCVGCPKGDKTKAEYRWYPGSVGSYPYCETCLREKLPQLIEDLDRTKKTAYLNYGRKSVITGFATPIGTEQPKIVIEEDLDAYLNGDLE